MLRGKEPMAKKKIIEKLLYYFSIFVHTLRAYGRGGSEEGWGNKK